MTEFTGGHGDWPPYNPPQTDPPPFPVVPVVPPQYPQDHLAYCTPEEYAELRWQIVALTALIEKLMAQMAKIDTPRSP